MARGARILDFDLPPDGAAEIARRARGTPRVAMRLLRRIRDFAAVHGWAQRRRRERRRARCAGSKSTSAASTAWTAAICARSPSITAAARSGSRRWRRRSASSATCSEEVIEPYLLQQGFLQRTPRGRMLTEIAFRHLDLPLPASLPASSTCWPR